MTQSPKKLLISFSESVQTIKKWEVHRVGTNINMGRPYTVKEIG